MPRKFYISRRPQGFFKLKNIWQYFAHIFVKFYSHIFMLRMTICTRVKSLSFRILCTVNVSKTLRSRQQLTCNEKHKLQTLKLLKPESFGLPCMATRSHSEALSEVLA